MSRRSKNPGTSERADPRTEETPQRPATPASAFATPMYPIDALRALFDSSWSSWARLVAAGEDLHRLQSVALDTAAAALSTAVSDAERARDVKDLFNVQVQWTTKSLEQWTLLHREWLDRLTAMTAGLTASPAAATAVQPPSRPAASDVASNGSTIWPTEMLMNAQTAWSQWAQQLANAVNRGVVPG